MASCFLCLHAQGTQKVLRLILTLYEAILTLWLPDHRCSKHYLLSVSRAGIHSTLAHAFLQLAGILSTVKRDCIPPRGLGPSTRTRRFTELLTTELLRSTRTQRLAQLHTRGFFQPAEHGGEVGHT